MTENAKWEPQGIPQPPKIENPQVANPGPIPPSVPNGDKNNKLPWFLWVFAGCGCFGFILLPIILFIIVIVAINPVERLKEAKERSDQVASQSAKEIKSTVGWNTFTSNELQVSFKVPTNYSIKEQQGPVQNTIFEELITVSDEKGLIKFAIIMAQTGTSAIFMYDKDTTIDGQKTKISYFKDLEIKTKPTDVLVSLSNKGKDFVVRYDFADEEFMTKVLSTFKFL